MYALRSIKSLSTCIIWYILVCVILLRNVRILFLVIQINISLLHITLLTLSKPISSKHLTFFINRHPLLYISINMSIHRLSHLIIYSIHLTRYTLLTLTYLKLRTNVVIYTSIPVS